MEGKVGEVSEAKTKVCGQEVRRLEATMYRAPYRYFGSISGPVGSRNIRVLLAAKVPCMLFKLFTAFRLVQCHVQNS